MASVTLASPGAVATATVGGSPYPITPSAAVGTGLANYTISYVAGALSVNPAPLTVTADDATKTYGETVTFAGTEFTAIGLQNSDTVASVTLDSAGAPPPPPSPAPVRDHASAAVGTGLGNYTISYVDGALTVGTATLTITADDARPRSTARRRSSTGTEFVAIGLLNSDLVDSVTVVSPGTPATATVAGRPVSHHAVRGRRHRRWATTRSPTWMVCCSSRPPTSRSRPTTRPRPTETPSPSRAPSSRRPASRTPTRSTASPSTAPVPCRRRPSPSARTRSPRRQPSGPGLGNYTITYVPADLTVTQADGVIVVTGYSVTYDALPHTATGTATGVLAEDLAVGLDLSATTHTNVGTYTDAWTFTDPAGNYNDASGGTVDSEIDPRRPDDHRGRRHQDLRRHGHVRGTEFTTSGLLGGTASQRHAQQRGRRGDRHGRRQPVRDHPVGRRGQRARELHDQLCRRQP